MASIADPTRAFASFNDYTTDVEPVLADAEVRNKVVALQKDPPDLDCIHVLDDIARLLEVAITASYGQVCHASLIGLAIWYQTLIDALRTASSTHLQTSMDALKHLKLAFFCLRKDEFDDATALLVVLPTLATRSEDQMSNLVEQVTGVLRAVQARMEEVVFARVMVVAEKDERAAHNSAVTALDMTMKALGVTKAKLEYVRYSVAMFKDRYRMATNEDGMPIELAIEMEDVDFLVDILTNNWYQWLALAKTNDTTVRGMDGIQTTMHRILSTLPNAAPVHDRLDEIIQQLQSRH